MNGDTTNPREELEGRITALILGELSTEEAAAVRQAIDGDAELARLHVQLRHTVDLVREAAETEEEETIAQASPSRLSEERRQQLLQSFKTVAPAQFIPARGGLPWFVPMGIAAALVGLVGSTLLLPRLAHSRARAERVVMLSDLEGRTDTLKELAPPEPAPAGSAPNPSPLGELAFTPSSRPIPKMAKDAIVLPPVNNSGALNPQEDELPQLRQQLDAAPAGIAAANSGGGIGGGGGYGGFGGVPPKVTQVIRDSNGKSATPPPGTESRRASDGIPSLGFVPGLGRLFHNNGNGTFTRNGDDKEAKQSSSLASAAPAPEGTVDKNELRSLPSTDFSSALTAPWTGGRQIGAQGGTPPKDLGNAIIGRYAYITQPTVNAPSTGREPVGQVGFQTNIAWAEYDSDGFLDLHKNAGQSPALTQKQPGVFVFNTADRPPDVLAPAATSVAGTALGAPLQPSAPAPAEPALAESQSPNIYRMDPRLAARYGLMPRFKSRVDEAAKKVADLRGEEARAGAAGVPSLSVDAPNRIDPTTGAPLPPPSPVPNLPAQLPAVAFESSSLQTLEPETAQNLERERTGALARADEFRRRVEQLEQEKANHSEQNDAKADAQLKGLKQQVLTQQEAANRLGDQLALSRAESAQSEPNQTATLWERLSGAVTGTVEQSAHVDLAKNSPDSSALLFNRNDPTSFDPYFVQTESEKVKSKAVLDQVIDKLKLGDTWSGKPGSREKLSENDVYRRLASKVEVEQSPASDQLEIRVRGDNAQEASQIAQTIADVYRGVREQEQLGKTKALSEAQPSKLAREAGKPQQASPVRSGTSLADLAPPKLAPSAPIPQPEVVTRDNPFSTFSLNVSDVSFKLAAASLEKGTMPDPATVRSEEFLNAFDYRDPEPAPGTPIGFVWERAHDPFAHDRDVVRFSIKTAAQGRPTGYPLNLVLLLDKSGSMERADRVQIIHEALRVLSGQLQPLDKLSIVTFARTARLWADGVPGNQAGQATEQVEDQTPEGGTNLGDALNLAYSTALKHYIQGGGNRVVLLTDGAANLGNVDPEALQRKVETERKQGIALDCFGVGWEGYNDDLLEVLSSHGDGRYGFLNSPEEAATGFAGQLAGALRVAAADVKVQVEFNPSRVTAYRQIGYAKHQLTKEQFRDNSVDAAELGAAESGNALYIVQVNSQGSGELATVRVRYRNPGTGEYLEHAWSVPYEGAAAGFEQAGSALRLAAVASAFSEWLVSSPYSGEVTPDRLLSSLRGVPETYANDPRPGKLEWMIRQAKSIAGK